MGPAALLLALGALEARYFDGAGSLGEIGGQVFDEAGTRAGGVTVSLVSVESYAGRRRFSLRQSTDTDEGGAYRFRALPAGDYAICALSAPASRVAAEEVAAIPASVAGEVCYPAAEDLRYAMPLRMAPGESRSGLALILRRLRAFTIAGRVAGFEERYAESIDVRLRRVQHDDAIFDLGPGAGSATLDASGRFTFAGVPAGSYIVTARLTPAWFRATATEHRLQPGDLDLWERPNLEAASAPTSSPEVPTLWAQAEVRVEDSDVRDVELALREAGAIEGRIVFERSDGTPERFTAGAEMGFEVVGGPFSGWHVHPSVRFSTGGRFAATGVVPGTYLMHVAAPSPWIVKSIVVGRRDWSAEPIEIDSGDLHGVLVTLTDRPNELLGTVVQESGAPDANADVIVFPRDRTLWRTHGPTLAHGRRVSTGPDGTFRVSVLPPGEYCVIAVQRSATAASLEPASLDRLSHFAVRVTMDDRSQRVVVLSSARAAR